ncbi:MAG: tetratricopeptide repeat protein [Tannerellaceae bacterium]|jgi:tetratricopeptide (TPR) repeat protein|nr:tetratricopeptide repeat protein [Tannerellaceae bacterium]
MGNFLKSFFSSETLSPDEIQAKDNQRNFDVFKYDGIRALGMGQVKYAIKCHVEALKIKEDVEVMQYLVAAYTAEHETDEALNVVNRLLEIDPDNLKTTLLSRASLFYQSDREEETIADCLRVIELDASNPAAWYLMGKAKSKLKDASGAVADLTQAIALKEDFADAYLQRAEILVELDQPEEAFADVEKLILLMPEEEAVYLLRGRIYERLSNLSAAADDYNQVVRLNPFNEEAVLLRGALLIKEGALKEAIDFFDEVIELKPEFADAYRGRGKAKSLIGNTEGALEDEKTAGELEEEGKEDEVVVAKRPNFDEIYKDGIF